MLFSGLFRILVSISLVLCLIPIWLLLYCFAPLPLDILHPQDLVENSAVWIL